MNIAPEPFILRPDADLLKKHPRIASLARQLSSRYVHRELVTDELLEQAGRALWESFSADEALRARKEAAGTGILPVLVETDDPALLVLPWESLHCPEYGFLGKHQQFTLSLRLPLDDIEPAPPHTSFWSRIFNGLRYLFSADRGGPFRHDIALPELRRGPLRVLLFTSQPDDLDAETARLNTEDEQAQVLEALSPLIETGLVKLEAPDDGRFSFLKKLLQEQEFHLVFLSGHGLFHHEPHSDEPPYAEFLFEGEDGRAEPVRDVEIAAAFVGSHVRAAVLAACQSGKTASDELNAGLARRLLLQGVPHVVGMRESVLDRAGILFARAFCDAAGRRARLDEAVQAGRRAVTQPLKDATWRDGQADGQGELSLGQWVLPRLLSRDPALPLIDWNFEARKPDWEARHGSALEDANIILPDFFIGRRRELRELGKIFGPGQPALLITGAGGQGKTALAGQLAKRMMARGWRLLAYSARKENSWDDFLFNVQLSLRGAYSEEYDRKRPLCDTPEHHARVLLGLLRRQHEGRLLLFFDNLESVQNPTDCRLTDANVHAWIEECRRFGGPLLLLTSRWKLPDWLNDAHHPLSKPGYGDFLRYVQHHLGMGGEHARLRRLYEALGGNFKGLQLVAAAQGQLSAKEEEAFIRVLETARSDLQTYMAIEKVTGFLAEDEYELLKRLPAYAGPAPLEGIVKLALDLPKNRRRAALQRLLDFSLADTDYAPDIQAQQYRISPLAAEWLATQGGKIELRHYQAAADYQRWLFKHQRPTIQQALAVHQALQNADQRETARTFALDNLARYFHYAGLYRTLLLEWLPDLRESEEPARRANALNWTGMAYHALGEYDAALEHYTKSLAILQEIGDKSGEGATLNNISQIFQARGDYDTALDYLKKSLAIRQEIGDKSGEGATLNNISQIYDARGDYDTALDYLKKSLAIRQEIGDKSGEGTTLNNISQIFKARGDYDTALDYLKKSLAIRQDIGDGAGMCIGLINMGAILFKQGKQEDGLASMTQGYVIAKQIGSAQALKGLESLGKQLGGNGLAFWEERLAARS